MLGEPAERLTALGGRLSQAAAEWLEGLISEPGSKALSQLSSEPQTKGGP